VFAIFLTCCVKGMEETRHFTAEMGTILALMLAFAVLVGAVLLMLEPVLVSRKGT
jgi:hypothetical protein